MPVPRPEPGIDGGRLGAVKPLEYVRQVLRGHTGPLVGDRQVPGASETKRHPDPSPWGSISAALSEDVHHGPLQQCGLGADLAGL